MATKLSKAISRETTRTYRNRPIIVTIAPTGSQNETLIGFRLKGSRTEYVVALSRLYIYAGQLHGLKEQASKREARRQGIPWRLARKDFIRNNSTKSK